MFMKWIYIYCFNKVYFFILIFYYIRRVVIFFKICKEFIDKKDIYFFSFVYSYRFLVQFMIDIECRQIYFVCR